MTIKNDERIVNVHIAPLFWNEQSRIDTFNLIVEKYKEDRVLPSGRNLFSMPYKIARELRKAFEGKKPSYLSVKRNKNIIK